MDWTTPIDIYCERVGPDFWAEPLNAISNAAFLVAAYPAYGEWRRKTPDDRWLLVMVILVATTSFRDLPAFVGRLGAGRTIIRQATQDWKIPRAVDCQSD